MIFDAQSYSFIFQDGIYSLAIGFIVGFFDQLLAVFLYKGKVKVFIKDMVTSLLFTVLIFSYSVSFVNYKLLRWYNVLFALLGWILFTPCFSAVGNALLKMAAFTIKMKAKNIGYGAYRIIQRHKQNNIDKKQKFTTETTDEVLKQNDILLYN